MPSLSGTPFEVVVNLKKKLDRNEQQSKDFHDKFLVYLSLDGKQLQTFKKCDFNRKFAKDNKRRMK